MNCSKKSGRERERERPFRPLSLRAIGDPYTIGYEIPFCLQRYKLTVTYCEVDKHCEVD